MGSPLYGICCFSVAALIFFIVFNFCLISICLDMFLLGFILYGTFCTSRTWVEFLAVTTSSVFSDHFSSSSPSGTPMILMLVQLTLSQGLWACPHFCSFYSAPLRLAAHLSVFLPKLLCYWLFLVQFSFQLLCCASLSVCSLVLPGPC